jgi:hypothetical protein
VALETARPGPGPRDRGFGDGGVEAPEASAGRRPPLRARPGTRTKTPGPKDVQDLPNTAGGRNFSQDRGPRQWRGPAAAYAEKQVIVLAAGDDRLPARERPRHSPAPASSSPRTAPAQRRSGQSPPTPGRLPSPMSTGTRRGPAASPGCGSSPRTAAAASSGPASQTGSPPPGQAHCSSSSPESEHRPDCGPGSSRRHRTSAENGRPSSAYTMTGAALNDAEPAGAPQSPFRADPKRPARAARRPGSGRPEDGEAQAAATTGKSGQADDRRAGRPSGSGGEAPRRGRRSKERGAPP